MQIVIDFKSSSLISVPPENVRKPEKTAVPRCSSKQVFLKGVLTGLKACNFIKKETLTQVFSCKYREIFKNIFFSRTPPVGASDQRFPDLSRVCRKRPIA